MQDNGTLQAWAKLGYVLVDNKLVKANTLVAKKVEKIEPLRYVNTMIRINEIKDEFLLPDGEVIKIKHQFDINPCAAPRMTQSDKWKTDPNAINPIMRQRKPVTKYFAFRNEFIGLCDKVGYKLTEVLDILFIIPFPKTYSEKKRKILNNQAHQLRPDRDNFLKSVQDSFKVDDGFVWDGRTIKLWGEKGQIIIF